MIKTILLSLLCTGCCACPPAPDQWRIDSPLDSIDLGVSAISLDALGDAYEYPQWTYLDSTTIFSTGPQADVPTVVEYGPWPCRWIHYTYEECCLQPDPITRYRVDGDKVTIIDQYIPAVAITYTVRDSVWHCGGDGEFRE
jgi:hypothetical protein